MLDRKLVRKNCLQYRKFGKRLNVKQLKRRLEKYQVNNVNHCLYCQSSIGRYPYYMELPFIKYSALVIIAAVIGVAGTLASSSRPIHAYNELFGLVSSDQSPSSPTSHTIFVSHKSKTSGETTFASTRSSNTSSQLGTTNKVVMMNFDDGYNSLFLNCKGFPLHSQSDCRTYSKCLKQYFLKASTPYRVVALDSGDWHKWVLLLLML
jgi:hypothetical protein